MNFLTQPNEVTPAWNSAFFQTEPSTNTSEKYNFISTDTVATYFKNKGFYISNYSEAQTIKPEYKGKSKHIVRLRRIGDTNTKDAPEILIINSHNKYSSLKINIGIYRFACANGLILGDTFFSEKVTHTGGNMYEQLDTLLMTIEDKFKEVDQLLVTMKNTKLTPDQIKDFSSKVIPLRFKGNKIKASSAGLQDFMNSQPTRTADDTTDLYTVMNILQEKAIKGGLQYAVTNNKNIVELKISREIKGLTQIENLNKDIFDLAMSMAA